MKKSKLSASPNEGMTMKLLIRSSLLFWLLFAVLRSLAMSQAGPSYDALIQQGKTQLQAGRNDLALASAEQAIKSDATRWEGYALAGGALMNLKRYEEAADNFSRAIDRAPQNKQDGLRELRRQCLAAEAGTAPASTPSTAAKPGVTEATTTQSEIVLWKSIENSKNREDFQDYLRQFPNGTFALMAQARLDKLAKADDDAQVALNAIRPTLKPVTIGSQYPTTYTPTAVELKACRLTMSAHVATDPIVRAYGNQISNPEGTAFSGDYVNTVTYDLGGPDVNVGVQDYVFWDNKMRKVNKNGESAVHYWAVVFGSRTGKVVSASCNGWMQPDAYGKVNCDGTASMTNSAQLYPFLQSDQAAAQELAETLKTLIAKCSKEQ